MRCIRVQLRVVKRMYPCGPATYVRWLPISLSLFVADVRLASDIIHTLYVYQFWFVLLFLGVLFHLRATGACPVTTDVIMRVNARKTTAVFSIISGSLKKGYQLHWYAVHRACCVLWYADSSGWSSNQVKHVQISLSLRQESWQQRHLMLKGTQSTDIFPKYIYSSTTAAGAGKQLLLL